MANCTVPFFRIPTCYPLNRSRVVWTKVVKDGFNCPVSTSFLEDSDDSVAYKDYVPDSNDTCSEDFGVEINMDKNAQENVSHPGRPKKGRKRKYPDQDRNIRKKRIHSNLDHHSAKEKFVRAKEFVAFACNCSMKCNEKLTVHEPMSFLTITGI
nr:unnamed protein product [Callosobruchus chinensis]